MINYALYDLPEVKKGDTMSPVKFAFSVHRDSDLVSAVLSNGTDNITLTITNAVAWEFELGEQIVTWDSKVHEITITITCADGYKNTYIRGSWNIG